MRGTSELRSTGLNLVPLLATRCLYWRVHLTEGQPDQKADQMSSWPDEVLFLATKCLYEGYIWAQVNCTQLSTTLGHKMPVPGGSSDLSTKRTSENSNTLCISCFASQRSFLRKTNEWNQEHFIMKKAEWSITNQNKSKQTKFIIIGQTRGIKNKSKEN